MASDQGPRHLFNAQQISRPKCVSPAPTTHGPADAHSPPRSQKSPPRTNGTTRGAWGSMRSRGPAPGEHLRGGITRRGLTPSHARQMGWAQRIRLRHAHLQGPVRPDELLMTNQAYLKAAMCPPGGAAPWPGPIAGPTRRTRLHALLLPFYDRSRALPRVYGPSGTHKCDYYRTRGAQRYFRAPHQV